MSPQDTIHPTTVIDTARRLLTDFSRCPACTTVLAERRCPACGLDLTGPDARQVSELSVRAAQTLGERDVVLRRMRTAPVTTVEPVVGGFSGAVPVSPPAPPAPSVPPLPPALSAPASGSERPSSALGVHGLLVGLGALLLSVAAVGFLVFSWHVLSLPGRAAVIAAATLGVLATASRLRGRLPETAEAVGALGVVLVLADSWAIRRTGLFGADRPDLIAYAAAAAAVSAVLLGGWAGLSRVRAGSCAAVTLAPVALLLAAARLDDGVPGPLPVFAIGLLLVAGFAAGRGVLPADWQAERWLLRAFAALALLGGCGPAGLGRPDHGYAALVLVAAAAVAAVQTYADRVAAVGRRSRSVALRRGWSLAAGGLAGTAAVQAGLVLADRLGRDDVTVLLPLVTVPVLAVVAAAAVPDRAGAALRRTAFASGVAVVAALAAVPVLVLAVWLPLRAGLIGVAAWSTGAGTRFGDLAPASGSGLVVWSVTLTGLGVVAAGAIAAARFAGWPTWLRRPVMLTGGVATGLALLVLPLVPSVPVGAVVGGLLLVAVGSVVLVASRRRVLVGAGLLISGVAGTLAVVTAWASRGLSVPVTVIGIAGLLLARRWVEENSRPDHGRDGRSPLGHGVRAALAGVALLSAAVVVGAIAGWVGVPSPLWIVWAGVFGGLSTAALLGMPRWWPGARPGRAAWTGVDRLAAAVPGLVALVLGLLATLADGSTPAVAGAAWPRPVLLAVALLIALTGVTAVRPAIVRLVPVLPLLSALALTPLLGAVVVAVPNGPHGPGPALLWAISAAVGALVVAVVVSAGRTSADPDRRVAAEIGVLCAALVGLSLVSSPEALWPVLLVLGAAASALAAPGDRPYLGWLAGLLLTGSTWTRLAVGNVTLVEAYSLPPALALLMLAGYRFYREGRTDPAPALLPVATVGLAPSILVATSGPALRPAVLLAVAAALVLAPVLRGRYGRRTGLGSVLGGVGVLTAGAVAVLRAGHVLLVGTGPGSVPWADLEVWTVPAAAILVFAALAGGERTLPTGSPFGRYLRASSAPPLLAGFLMLGGPTLLAALVTADRVDGTLADGPLVVVDPTAVVRTAIVLALSIVTGLSVFSRFSVRASSAGVGLGAGATALAVAASLAGLTLSYGPAEVWTLPTAALLLIQGFSRFREHAGERSGRPASWAAYGPGIAVLLLPSLYLALTTSTGSPWREVTVITLAGATLVLGAGQRLQAPVLLGAGVLGVQTVALLLPWFAALSGAVPIWGWLAVVGVALIVLGARYEARVRQLRTIRLRLAALR